MGIFDGILICTDLDGTLYRNDKSISEENKEAIEFFKREGGKLIYTMKKCRVQSARERKGMPYHPCKPVGEIEYSGFAKTIDDRITCRCLSCYPDVTDSRCCCKWEFSI